MSRKVFHVTVELDVQAVTCPGVWLCPKGKMSIRINMLDSTAETSDIEPVFPLLVHETFTFSYTFPSVRYLADLAYLFSGQLLSIQLIQWSASLADGNILATFETSLEELLYPAPRSRALVAGVDVDLLMEPTACFPGILAPKIEVSTKTTIEEKLNSAVCDDSTSVFPKMLSSRTVGVQNKRQRKVCHSRSLKLPERLKVQSCVVKRQVGRRPAGRPDQAERAGYEGSNGYASMVSPLQKLIWKATSKEIRGPLPELEPRKPLSIAQCSCPDFPDSNLMQQLEPDQRKPSSITQRKCSACKDHRQDDSSFTNGLARNGSAYSKELKQNGCPCLKDSKRNSFPFSKESKQNGSSFSKESKRNCSPFSKESKRNGSPFSKESKRNGSPFSKESQWNGAPFSKEPKRNGCSCGCTRQSKPGGSRFSKEPRHNVSPSSGSNQQRSPRGRSRLTRRSRPKGNRLHSEGSSCFPDDKVSSPNRSRTCSPCGRRKTKKSCAACADESRQRESKCGRSTREERPMGQGGGAGDERGDRDVGCNREGRGFHCSCPDRQYPYVRSYEDPGSPMQAALFPRRAVPKVPYRESFYRNLEKFYKRLYYQAIDRRNSSCHT